MQRAGKTHRAALSDGMQDMKLRNFFREAQEVLEAAGEDDSAFYFEQVVEHLNAGKGLPIARKEIARVLGL
jgi:hypothetical protein